MSLRNLDMLNYMSSPSSLVLDGWFIGCFFGSSWVLLSRPPRLEIEVDWGESAVFSVDEEEMDVCCRSRIICLYLLVFCLLTSMICFLFWYFRWWNIFWESQTQQTLQFWRSLKIVDTLVLTSRARKERVVSSSSHSQVFKIEWQVPLKG